MTVAEIALLITTLSGAIVALLGVRANTSKLSDLQEQLEDAKEKQDWARRDIILMGEQYAGMHKDIINLVILVNKLYIDYQKDTGHKPDIDWATFDRFITVQHITTPLGPLQVKE